jgi:hypothetical protein
LLPQLCHGASCGGGTSLLYRSVTFSAKGGSCGPEFTLQVNQIACTG